MRTCLRDIAACIAALALAACGASTIDANDVKIATDSLSEDPRLVAPSSGTLDHWFDLASEHIEPRNVSIWLPEGYGESEAQYPVLYMHDGANLFLPKFSYTGDEWQVDEALARLIADGAIPPVIVVGIWNTETRWQDYVPQKVVERLPEDLQGRMLEDQGAPVKSDAYLRFIVEELKPRVDAAYRTLPGRETTFIAGSSMGGLISLYAAGEYGDVFGGAACLSIHWPLADPTDPDAMEATSALVDWLDASAIDPDGQRLWFDQGTINLDSFYAPYSEAIEAAFDDRGWPAEFRVYDGADHNEAAWAERLPEVLAYLIAGDANAN